MRYQVPAGLKEISEEKNAGKADTQWNFRCLAWFEELCENLRVSRKDFRSGRASWISLGVTAIFVVGLAGCTSLVAVEKSPLTVKKVFFDPENPVGVPLTPDEEAVTVWSFGCKSDFEFDIVDNTRLKQNDVMVTLRITRSKITLSAPVTVFLPEGASSELVRHEEGHVEICKRIYGKVDKEAEAAASAVVGKEYQASGASVEDACREAVQRAGSDVCLRYHGISRSVNRVSNIYDQLDRTDHDEMPVLVNKAFATFSTVSGVGKPGKK